MRFVAALLVSAASADDYFQVATHDHQCVDEAYAVIESQAECEAAAKALGLKHTSASTTKSLYRASVPYGCYQEMSGAQAGLWFNPGATSTADGTAHDDRAICVASKQTDYAQVSNHDHRCADEGYSVLETQTECKAAARSLGLKYTKATTPSSKFRASVPYGCYQEMSGSNAGLYFNPAATSTATGAAHDDRALCSTAVPSPSPSPIPSPSPTPSPSPIPSPPPTYATAHEDVTVGGYTCGYSQKARVVYPVTAKKVPVISFAHGFLNPGAQAYTGYKTIVEGVAMRGFVVIVLESAAFPLECSDEYQDQLRSLEWISTSKFAARIDYTKQTGILGHSMGGGATYRSSSQAAAVKTYNIGAAVALNPQVRNFLPTANPLVPIFFGTGSSDSVISPVGVKAAYGATSGVPKVFVNAKGSSHMNGAKIYVEYAAAMFDCHLLNDRSQCQKVYGTREDSLCTGKWHKVTECEHANEPQLDSVSV